MIVIKISKLNDYGKVLSFLLMAKITLHNLDNRQIEILSSYIKKLMPINNHAYFPELKTQVILNSASLLCSVSDNWIYVKETPEQIKFLIARANKIFDES